MIKSQSKYYIFLDSTSFTKPSLPCLQTLRRHFVITLPSKSDHDNADRQRSPQTQRGFDISCRSCSQRKAQQKEKCHYWVKKNLSKSIEALKTVHSTFYIFFHPFLSEKRFREASFIFSFFSKKPPKIFYILSLVLLYRVSEIMTFFAEIS